MTASTGGAGALAPTGTLRVAIAVAPAPSVFFCTKDENGAPQGIAVDIAHALADELTLPLELVVYPNSGELTDAAASGVWDITFMPQDAERAKKVDFGPAYFIIESSYLVPAGSPIQAIEEVNRPGTHIVGIFNTTTARSARRTAPLAMVEEVRSVDEMTERARHGQGDAFALSHDAFIGLLPKLPGSRVLPGHFQSVGVAVAVPKDRPGALAVASAFIERAKASGVVRTALDAAGFDGAPIAPSDA
ncbi:MAG: transporter substrate-binding domain-containing protein [Rhizobiales bacterium]|nr:transporter substrate-binding domain-containing protein [Hyphomicrobiales bacterium]